MGPFIFLIAHTAAGGHGAAQATIVAKSAALAITKFEAQYPERVPTVLGVKGDPDGGVAVEQSTTH